jgi:hypothetical protein
MVQYSNNGLAYYSDHHYILGYYVISFVTKEKKPSKQDKPARKLSCNLNIREEQPASILIA